MPNVYFLPIGLLGALLCGVLAPAQAQAPTVVGVAPAANAPAAPRTSALTFSFSQPLTAASAGALRVFSSQRGGLRSSLGTVAGTTLSVAPTAYDYRPGETVQYTLTRTAAGSGGPLLRPRVGQFTAAVVGTGRGSFVAGTSPTAGAGPAAVALGDVDADGDPDLLTANLYSGTVSVRLNTGGAFAGTQEVAVGLGPVALALADVDGDGDLDLATALSGVVMGGSNAVAIRLNNGSGVFGPGSDVPAAASPLALALADVDGDGDLDLMFALDAVAGSVAVRLNDGTGTFSGTQAVAVGYRPQALALGDLDNDGDLDLVAPNFGPQGQTNGTVSVRFNDGSGTFSGTREVAVGRFPIAVALGDVDNDGDLDLAVANYTGVGSASVNPNNGSGVFLPAPNIPVGSEPTSLALADVDADGDLDLLTANNNTRGAGTIGVSLRLNTGGTFSTVPDIGVANQPSTLAVADVDNDGDLDLVLGNAGTVGGLDVRLNGGTGPLAAAPAATPAVLTAFPNPATGRVQLTLPPAATSAELLDALGRPVRSVPAANGAATLDVAGLPPGLYLVRAAGQVARLVVE